MHCLAPQFLSSKSGQNQSKNSTKYYTWIGSKPGARPNLINDITGYLRSTLAEAAKRTQESGLLVTIRSLFEAQAIPYAA
jgi:hypothetical protein